MRNDSDSTVTAGYAYTYDLADNLLSKSEPFLEDFEDGNYTGWSANAGCSASGGVMAESDNVGIRRFRRTKTYQGSAWKLRSPARFWVFCRCP